MSDRLNLTDTYKANNWKSNKTALNAENINKLIYSYRKEYNICQL